MAEELFIPKLGQTVEEVTIVNWLVDNGTKVDAGQDVLEVETDKAIFPVPAPARGYLHRGPFDKGDVVPVLAVVAIVGKEDEKFVAASAAISTPPGAATAAVVPEAPTQLLPQAEAQNGKVFASPRARKLAEEKKVDLSRVIPTGGSGTRVREADVRKFLAHIPQATPVAQNVAAETGVSLENIPGSGPGGRITKQDVLQAAGATPKLQPATQQLTSAAETVIQRIPLEGVRAIIADRMGASVHTTARVTLVSEVDATRLVEMREKFKVEVSQEWGFAPGYNDFLAIIVAKALKEFPYMNARLSADGKAIEQLDAVHLGLAVDTERGLLVPVIHNADRLGLRSFGARSRELINKARAARCLPDELSGGTFTITNLGMYEIDAFTPVINIPEIAILGVGRIVLRPVFDEKGQVVGRQMLTLSLVFDHRLTDGAPAARFLQRVKRLVENPYLLLE